MDDELEQEEDEFTQAYQEMCLSAMGLCVNVGIISSIQERWPDEIRQNWLDEVRSMGEKIADLQQVAQEFASGLD